MLVDTHVHINFDVYDQDRDAVMQRAYDLGVTRMLHSCCKLTEIPELLSLSEKYDGVNTANLFVAFGVHPTEVGSAWDEHSKDILEDYLDLHVSSHSREGGNPKVLANSSKVKAIGETGLDFYHAKEQEEHQQQKSAFQEQIKIAKKYKLPLIVHTRDAWQDTLSIIENNFEKDKEAHNGVLHCYTGNLDFALACIERGFYVSWSGILTFKKLQDLRELAKQIPLDRTLIETDCPFLAPQQKRGMRNEPSFVNYVAEVLADCHNMSKEEIARVTTENAEQLFKI